jgi:hypothetical protein
MCETEEHVIPANFFPALEWLFLRDEATSAKDHLVLVSGKIGASERTATVSIRQSVARYLNPMQPRGSGGGRSE